MDFPRSGKISRTARALPHYFDRLRTVRQRRAELIADDAGSRYPGLDGVIYGDVINLLQEARIALALSMTAFSPRFLARTHSADWSMRAFAQKGGRTLNAWSPRIRLQQSLVTVVADAFFSIGIGKSYMADAPAIALENDVFINPGKPFFAPRSVDHFVWDLDATDFRYCSVIADRYRACLYDIVDDDRFPDVVRNRLYREGPESPSQEALGERIANSNDGSDEQIEPSIFLAESFDPKDKLIHLWAVDDTFSPKWDEPLYTMEWEGREEGPYHFLNLGYVPHHTVPSSPAQNLSNLHNFANTLYRKLQDQAELMKVITVSKSGDEEDAERMRTAVSGDHVGLNNPDTVKQIRLDGPDQNLFTLMLSVVKMFDRAGGNVEYRLGLGQQADTASQEQQIGAQVNRLEGYYQLQFVDFVREVGREQFRMLYNDAATEIPMSLNIPGTEFHVQDDWRGAYEEGARPMETDEMGIQQPVPFNVFDVDLDPYSMAYKSPSQRISELRSIVGELLPLEPLLNQRGKGLNVNKYLDLLGQYGDWPELRELYEQNLPPMQQDQEPASLLSSAGDHTYTHRSVGSGKQNDAMQMAQMMTGPSAQGE